MSTPVCDGWPLRSSGRSPVSIMSLLAVGTVSGTRGVFDVQSLQLVNGQTSAPDFRVGRKLPVH